MNRFKERVLREIINLGRKNDGMRMPAIVLLAVFLTLYHAVRDFFLQFRYHPVRQRVLAGILILALLSGQVLPYVFAVNDTGVYSVSGNLQISAFAKLPKEVQEQVVPVGTDVDKLTLPDTLEAFVTVEYTDTVQVEEESVISAEPVVQDNISEETCATGDAKRSDSNTENVTTEAAAVPETTEATTTEKTEIQETRTQTEAINIQGVTWTAKTEYDKDTEGAYIFTAVLPEGYVLMEGASLPQITVTVCADSAEEPEAADGGKISLLMRPLDEGNSSDMVYYMEDSFESYSWEVWTGEEWQEIGETEPELVVSKEDWYTYRFRCIAKKEGFFYTANAKDGWQDNMGIMLMAENGAGGEQSDYMYYSNTGSYFNIKGLDNGNLIQTTYADRGYRTASSVGGGSKVSWNSAGEIAMGNSLYGSREISLVYNGRYAKIIYTVTNKGSSAQSFKVGSSADVMIGNNDCAPVVGSSNGLVMNGSPKNTYTFNLVAPTANTLWYGHYSKAYENIFTNLADRSTAYNKDSGMAWSWSDTVAPGQTWSRYVLLGVGDLPEAPETPTLTNTNPKLEPGVPTTFTGTANPGNTVSVEVGGEEFIGTADGNGNFSVTVNPPQSLPEGQTDVNYYAVSADGGISDVGTITATVTKKPAIALTDAETTVAEDDSTLNDAWYRSFIGSYSGEVSYDASSVNVGTPGTYTVTYTARKAGYADATATLRIKVLPQPLELSPVTATRVSGKNSFTLSASLIHTGVETITETGFVWGTMQNPTLDLNNGSKSTASVIKTKGGVLTLNADDVVDGITYYVRAYVKTSDGSIYYSSQQSFSIDGKNYGTFNIVNNNNKTFTVTRTGGSDDTQTVYFRTVNGSAVGGTHFDHKAGELTFAQGENSKTITITEHGVTMTYGSKPATAYSNADRTYQVEIYRVDGGGTLGDTTRATRTMTKNSGFTVDRNCYVTKKEAVNNGDIVSKNDSVAENSPTYAEAFTMNRFYTSYVPYLKETAYKYEMHMNVNVYEYEDGWEYLRFTSGSQQAVAKFEVNPTGNCREWKNGWIPRERDFTENGVIHSYDFTGMEPYASTIHNQYVFGFDINTEPIKVEVATTGNGANDWTLGGCEQESVYSDIQEPQLIGIAPMDTSTYRVGDKVTISLVFDEIVDKTNSNQLTGSSFITTSWGEFYYAGGADTNILYFTGTVPANAGSSISVTNLNCAGQIKDMCNNTSGTASGGSGSTTVKVNNKVPTVSITNTSVANQTAKATISATNADKLEYTWTKSSTLPVTGWLSAMNKSSQTVGNRLTPGKWYLHVLATYNATGKTTHKYEEFTITDTGTTQGGEVVPPDLTLSADNSTWARQRTITVTKKPSGGTVKVKTPSGTTYDVTGSSYTAVENGSYLFTLTAGEETVVKSITVSKIDRSSPTVSITGPDSITQNENVKLTIKPVDTGGSGVKTVTGTWARKTNDGNTETIEAGLTKNADGTYSATTSGTTGNKYTYLLSVTVTDNAGNTKTVMGSTYTVNLKVPTVTVTRTDSNPQTGDTYSYNVNANENTITAVQLPDGTVTTALSGTFTLTSIGTYYVIVSDAAGHVVRSSAMTVTKSVDVAAPEVRLNQQDEKWTDKAEVSLDVSIYEEGSIAFAVWKKDGESLDNTLTYSSEEASVYDGSFSVTQNGTYTVTVTDAAGNTGTGSIEVKNIDRTKPEVTCAVDTAANATTGWHTDENVQIKLTFADKTGAEGGTPSGIKTVQYKPVTGETATPAKPTDGLLSLDPASSDFKNGEFTYNINGNGKYYLYYKVTDNRGNVTDGFSELVKKDSCGESAVITGADKGQPETDGLDMSIKLTYGPSGGTLYVGMDSNSVGSANSDFADATDSNSVSGMVASFVSNMLADTAINDTELATVSGYDGMDVANKTITKNYNGVTDTGRHYFRYYNNASGTSSYWYFYVHSITFDSQGGSDVESQLVWTTQESGSADTAVQCAVTKPSDPTRIGYTFGGWYTDAACTSGKEFDFATQVRKNTTIYAKWTADSYSITYDLNDGELATGITNPSTYTIESDDIILNNPTRTGYTFKGWSGTDLTDNANTEVTIAKGSTGNRSYTANWTSNEYTVTFDYQNATGGNDTENKTVTYDSTYGALPMPERTGYTFTGWYTAADAAGTKVESTTKVTMSDNHTLYAGWTPKTYIVTFDYQNATEGNDTENKTVTYDSAYGSLPEPERTGYTFTGWYTAADDTGIKVESTTKVTTSDNHTLYAGWTTVTYDFTYDLKDGEFEENATNPSEYTIESDDITLNNPTRTGYTFKGWSGTDLTGDENMSVTIAKGSMGDRSYTANWTPKTYTVTFDYQNATGGNDTENMTVTYDSAYGTLPTPERTDYTFTGWYTEESQGTEVTGTTIVKTADNHTIYARWKDETAPAALALPSDISLPTDWTRTQNTIPLVLHDNAGVTELWVSIDGGEYEKVEDFDGGTEYNYAVKEGEHTYRFKAKDAAGNTSDESEEFKIKLDTASPEITVSADRKPTDEEAQPDGTELSESYYDSAPAITVTVKDNKAGEGAGTEGTDTAGVTSVSYYIGDTEYPVTIDGAAPQGQAVFTIPAGVIPEGETTITIKAKDSAGNEMTETITVRVKIPEEKPETEIDYEAEKLTGLVPNETYAVTYTDENGEKQTEEIEATTDGVIQLKDEWKGKEITVNKKGNGDDKKDSEGQSISIPKSPDKPNADKIDAGLNAQDGAITGLDASLTYEIRVKDADGNFSEWKDAVLDGTEIKNLPAGEYEVRVKAVENVSLPGEPTAITIGTYQPAEITPPTGDRPTDNKPEPNDNNPTDNKPTSENSLSAGSNSQTIQAYVENGKITVPGEAVETGNINEASETVAGTEDETILEAGDGAVIVRLICEDETYTAGVKDTVAVANAVLSEEQIQLVNDGETIEILIDVKDISKTVSGQDKDVIEGGLAECQKEMPNMTLGMYIDISMFIRIDGGDWDAITLTSEPIEVVIGIPKELKADDREFYIIRSHDGEYTLLPDTDNDPDTITISTDMFSAYAIVYEQADNADDTDNTDNADETDDADKTQVSASEEKGAKCGLCHICPTFLGICCFIWLAIILAIFVIIWIVIRRKKKVKESNK